MSQKLTIKLVIIVLIGTFDEQNSLVFQQLQTPNFLRRSSTLVRQVWFSALKVGQRQVLCVVCLPTVLSFTKFYSTHLLFCIFSCKFTFGKQVGSLGSLAWLLSGDSKSERSQSSVLPTRANK